VVIATSGGGAAKPVAHLREKPVAKRVESRVGDRLAEALDFGKVAALFFARRGIAGEEIGDRGVVEMVPDEIGGVDAVLVLRPLGFEADDGVFGEGFGVAVKGSVGPDFQAEISGGVGEDEFEIRLSALRDFRCARLELGVDGGGEGDFTGEFFGGCDGDGTHGVIMAERFAVSRLERLRLCGKLRLAGWAQRLLTPLAAHLHHEISMRDLTKRIEITDRFAPVHSRPPGKFYDFCRVVWRGVFGCTMRVKSSGLETLAATGGVLIAVSHVSHLDPIVVSALLERRVSWVSRKEFYQQWLMRTVLHHGGAFRVDRTGSALPTIREGLRRLKRGEAVGIFPEGELMGGNRSVLRGATVKRGVCLLAARSGCPVIPVVVLGTDRLAKIGPWLPVKRGRLWVMVGPPMWANEAAKTKTGRADFATKLEAEYVRLYAETREAFGLPETIVP